MVRWLAWLVLGVFLRPAPVAGATEFLVRESESLFAVVTHRAGFAGGLAHDHLVAASAYSAVLNLDEGSAGSTRFELRAPVEKLLVDEPGLRQSWSSRLVELGILDGSLKEISEKDRGKIRESMLDKNQLDVERFPQVSARVVAVEERAMVLGNEKFPYRVTLAMEVHGTTVEKPVAARYELEGGVLSVEAVGTLRFTDFGIKPYSAMLGAVKNQDEFHVYVSLKAVPQAQ